MLEELSGLGPKTKQALERLGITSLEDLIEYYPYRYELIKRSNMSELKDSDNMIIDGIVETIPRVVFFKKHMNRMSFQMRLEDRLVEVTIFNRAYLKKDIVPGSEITVFGKWNQKKNQIVATNIRFGLLTEEKIECVYHLVERITNQKLSLWIAEAMTKVKPKRSILPIAFEEKYHFLSKEESIKEIHHPTSSVRLKKARVRFKYEELFEFLFKMTVLKEERKKEIGLSRIIDRNKVDELIERLSFSLTEDQKKAVDDILNDLENQYRMNRLIQGDVGSGKTILAFIASYMNFLSGYQTAFMAPTEILATQHYVHAKELLEPFGVSVVLLTGKLKVSEKKDLYEQIQTGNAHVIIGTHALISEQVHYQNLGLVITDEQHRFGVQQRKGLKNKGTTPDILYMSATPIPRTYALTIYGDMDVSSIKTRPVGRKEVITSLKKESEIKNILKDMLRELKEGHQIYVIAPLIKEDEESNKTSVETMEKNMRKAFGKFYEIGVLHGKQDAKTKEEMMVKFQKNQIQILISTTVIEVGVDVANATMMVIFDAERFGLSQLHQLRGRVGRSDLQSYCILVSNYDKERLQILTQETDGFKISEEDFRLRGSGDFFGVRQSGDMNFKVADICKDYAILKHAKEDAEELIHSKQYVNKEEEIFFETMKKQIVSLD